MQDRGKQFKTMKAIQGHNGTIEQHKAHHKKSHKVKLCHKGRKSHSEWHYFFFWGNFNLQFAAMFVVNIFCFKFIFIFTVRFLKGCFFKRTLPMQFYFGNYRGLYKQLHKNDKIVVRELCCFYNTRNS